MTVTSQRPLKILIRYKKRSHSSISLFLKVKWPSDSIVSRAVNSLPNVLVLVNIGVYTIVYSRLAVFVTNKVRSLASLVRSYSSLRSLNDYQRLFIVDVFALKTVKRVKNGFKRLKTF